MYKRQDCANCGASEGTVPGSPIHKPCGRCKITYYCSVRCQKQHWKVGGHKKRCVAKEDRSAAKAEVAEAEAAKAGKGRQAAAAKAPAEDGGEGEECVICLERLDDPQFGPAQTLECTHRFHQRCLLSWCRQRPQGGCPICREEVRVVSRRRSRDGAAATR